MFGVILRRRLQITLARNGFISSKSRPDLRYFLGSSFSSSAISSGNEEIEKAYSFTVSYLVNSCGLSPESAIVASEKVQFRNPKKPDSVIAFLRDHEFSETQISNFVGKRPQFLVTDPEKFFLPKFEFFYSKGLSKMNLAIILSAKPFILSRSLNRHIIPTYDLLKDVFQSDEEVVAALMRQRESVQKHWNHVVSNIRLLRDFRVSNSIIGSALSNLPKVLILEPWRLFELVNKVKDMGFDPEKHTFMLAIHAFSTKSMESRWRQNYDAYRRWGWSEDDILKAFRYHPNCMTLSENKISKVMDFLVNKMGWSSEKIAKCPVVLFYSFEKRIFLRCSVVRVLLLKGLIEQTNVNFVTMLNCVEEQFLATYVTKYLDRVPLLLRVYQGKDKFEVA